ncbi:MAG TPA: hypothetical protein VHC98_01905 [Candidatus Saccharimonadales bacterium]|nr:hypothetical protein [Candidatus Saccharimonadales bacterium]
MSHAKVSFNDVRFTNGHNVMADPETGAVRLVEQTALEPGAYREPNELIAAQLFTELDALISPTRDIAQEVTPRDQMRRRYAYSLMKQAVQDVDPKDLYIRTRRVNPDHPGYRNAWFFQNWQQLTDQQYQSILDNFRTGKGYSQVNYDGRGFTEALSPELIDALHADDFDAFVGLVTADRHKMDITDEADPRYGSVTLLSSES